MARAPSRPTPIAVTVRSANGRRRGARTVERAASVLVPAYNEEQNIAALLRRISAASGVDGWLVDDIILVASGCSDATVERAREVRNSEGLAVRIIEQETREGKAAAINLGLSVAHHDLIVLVSGDVLPAPGAVTALLHRLEDPTVGVVGARPVPMNSPSTFTGYAAHLLWRLHDAVNRAAGDNPKCGELIAFRKRVGDRLIVPAIPMESAVDEVSIQQLAQAAGLRSAYAPDAVVNNWGPGTVHDWFRQRRRIAAGHIISKRQGYEPSTMRTGTVLRSILRDPAARKRPAWVFAVVAMEVIARFYGQWDVARGRGHAVWKVAATTKRAIGEEVSNA